MAHALRQMSRNMPIRPAMTATERFYSHPHNANPVKGCQCDFCRDCGDGNNRILAVILLASSTLTVGIVLVLAVSIKALIFH